MLSVRTPARRFALAVVAVAMFGGTVAVLPVGLAVADPITDPTLIMGFGATSDTPDPATHQWEYSPYIAYPSAGGWAADLDSSGDPSVTVRLCGDSADYSDWETLFGARDAAWENYSAAEDQLVIATAGDASNGIQIEPGLSTCYEALVTFPDDAVYYVTASLDAPAYSAPSALTPDESAALLALAADTHFIGAMSAIAVFALLVTMVVGWRRG